MFGIPWKSNNRKSKSGLLPLLREHNIVSTIGKIVTLYYAKNAKIADSRIAGIRCDTL